MKLTEILNRLPALDESELVKLNRAVCDKIKAARNRDAEHKRAILSEGDVVEWDGRHGLTSGTITKVNRKKAKVRTTLGMVWTVPLNMLRWPKSASIPRSA